MPDGISKTSREDEGALSKNDMMALRYKIDNSQKDQKEFNTNVLTLFFKLNHSLETMSGVFDKDKKDGVPYYLKQYNKYAIDSNRYLKDMTLGVKSLAEQIKDLTEHLGELEKDRAVLRDPRVKEETHKAQRMMVRKNQVANEKAAPGMLMRGLFSSSMAPKWSQWISNMIGVRPFEMRKEELEEEKGDEFELAEEEVSELIGQEESEEPVVEGDVSNETDEIEEPEAVADEKVTEESEATADEKVTEESEATVDVSHETDDAVKTKKKTKNPEE